MSDEHSKQRLEIDGQVIDSDINEVDADRATNSSDDHEQHEPHDSRYWHAACRVRDCKFGFPEWKVSSYCCKAGWKHVLEEPFFRSKSWGMASRRPGSVTMLPSLLSNLTLSRTRSDPCIFGKDFLRITLPLPGEPGDCGGKSYAIEKEDCGAVENMDEPGEGSPVLDASAAPFIVPCKKELSKTSNKLDVDSFVGVQHSFDMEFSESFGVILSVETSSDNDAAVNCPKGGVNNSSRNSRTPLFDDWWTWHPNECTQTKKHPAYRGIQSESNSNMEHFCKSTEETEMYQTEEEGSEEGYLVFEEHKDEQLGRIKDEGNSWDDGGEESKHDINNGWEEEVFEGGEFNSENSPKRYKEDDIWSDEHFVSSQAKGFPPPISILANETHPGLPGHMPRTLWRSVKRDGRFVLQEVQAQPREFFRATRECGRLRLQLVRPDSDPLGSYIEAMSKEDTSGSISFACASGIESLAGNLLSVKSEESGILHKDDRSQTSIQEIDALQPENCWTSVSGAKVGVAVDKLNNPKHFISSSSSFKECGTVLEVETWDPGKECTELFRVGSSASVGLEEELTSRGRNSMTKVSCMTNHSLSIAPPCQFQDLGEEETGRVSNLGKADYREKPVGLCLSACEVRMSSDTGVKQNMCQVDAGEWTMERMGYMDLCTKPDVGQIAKVEDCDKGNHSNVVVPHEEQFSAYQHPCFNSKYGFDSNLKALSPNQAFIPIQPAVR